MREKLTKFMMVSLVAIPAMSIFTNSNSARAERITFEVTGRVTSITSNLASRFSAGDLMTMTYTFESETPDNRPSNPDIGVYFAIVDLTIRVGSYTATAPAGRIVVQNNQFFGDAYSVSDEFGGSFTVSGPSLNGLVPRSVAMAMQSLGDSTVLSDDTLPLAPPSFDLTLVNSNSWQLAFEPDIAAVSGRFDSISVANSTRINPVVDNQGRDFDVDGTFDFLDLDGSGVIRVGQDAAPFQEFRSAFEFDISAIPADATIVAATLSLHVSQLFPELPDLELHGYAGDGTITLSDMTETNLVAGPFTAIPEFNVNDVTSHIQDLVNAGSGIAGFMLKMGSLPPPDVNTNAQINTVEFILPERRPLLTVVYSKPPTPFIFTKIADNDTQIPGEVFNFTSFAPRKSVV